MKSEHRAGAHVGTILNKAEPYGKFFPSRQYEKIHRSRDSGFRVRRLVESSRARNNTLLRIKENRRWLRATRGEKAACEVAWRVGRVGKVGVEGWRKLRLNSREPWSSVERRAKEN